MASLICWASGLLQVVPDKEVPYPGPIVLLTGTSNKLNDTMAAQGEFRAEHQGWYVPGCVPIPDGDDNAAGAAQQANMTKVIEFNKKLQRARAKQKGLKHLKELDDAT